MCQETGDSRCSRGAVDESRRLPWEVTPERAPERGGQPHPDLLPTSWRTPSPDTPPLPTGTWLQPDPLGIDGGLNLYQYAHGDPVNLSDPSGLCVPAVPNDLRQQAGRRWFEDYLQGEGLLGKDGRLAREAPRHTGSAEFFAEADRKAEDYTNRLLAAWKFGLGTREITPELAELHRTLEQYDELRGNPGRLRDRGPWGRAQTDERAFAVVPDYRLRLGLSFRGFEFEVRVGITGAAGALVDRAAAAGEIEMDPLQIHAIPEDFAHFVPLDRPDAGPGAFEASRTGPDGGPGSNAWIDRMLGEANDPPQSTIEARERLSDPELPGRILESKDFAKIQLGYAAVTVGPVAAMAAGPSAVAGATIVADGLETAALSATTGLSPGALAFLQARATQLVGQWGRRLAVGLGGGLDAMRRAARALPGDDRGVLEVDQLGKGLAVGDAAGGTLVSAPKALPAPKTRGNPNPIGEHGTFYMDPEGNTIPTPPGGKITGSPDGRFIQARDTAGSPTGVRIDGPHRPASHPDPRAQQPHGHVPGVTNPDGTPWLTIKQ